MADVRFLAEQVERRPTDALVPYARNARTHSPEQVSQIAASMREFGWTYPVLIDEDDGIIAGHGRILAAQKLKLAEVPVMVARGWSAAQKRAYILADNKLALNADWDEGLLRVELGDLQSEGFDLSLMGFSSLDLTKLFSTEEGLTDPDKAPEPPVDPVSRLGDLWHLGDHLLICGDCTDPAVVERVLAGARPHLMITDPPYGVKYDPKWRDDLGIDWTGQQKKTQRRSTHPNAKPISGRALGKVDNDDRADWREAWALFRGNIAYIWHGGLHAGVVQASLLATGFTIRGQIIWVKQHFVFSRGDYHWQHEPCWYAVRGTGNWKGDRKQTTVWEIQNASAFKGNKDDQTTGHGTQKPVECMGRPMLNNSEPSDHVYEPFSGSGTTIIAGQMNKRVVHAIELSPAYVDVACKRFADFTGVAPTLDETGETFEQVKARRSEVV